MSYHGEVLVAILSSPADLAIARDQHWYRVPVEAAAKHLADHWPPKWLAFYQTRAFGAESFSISLYAKVVDIRVRPRHFLFPAEPLGAKAQRRYYQLLLEPLRQLPKPIPSARRRRVTFIPTTWDRFVAAREIEDLCRGTPHDEGQQLSLFDDHELDRGSEHGARVTRTD